MNSFKSGYVGIIGKPNVGKSTLLNRFLGEKLAIISPKPQTTRTRIQGILTGDNYQIIFIDTPGIHQPKDQLHQFMMREIDETVKDVDLILYLVEPNERPGPEDKPTHEYMRKIKPPVFLVVNKIDRYPGWTNTAFVKNRNLTMYKNRFGISALQGTGCDELLKKIIESLDEGPQFYPDDQLTDRTERFLIAELIREKTYEYLHQEIPYSVAVVTEEVKERPNNISFIRATVYVEKESQKGILIGDKGAMLKQIGQSARREIEILMGKRIYLELYVKVKKDWRKNPAALKEFGLRN